MNKAALIAVTAVVSIGALRYFEPGKPTHEQDFLRQGTAMQEVCRAGANSLRFRDQLMRVDLAFRMAKPEIDRKSGDRRYLFETALARWHCAMDLFNMEDRGEELIAPKDFQNWSRVLGKDTLSGRADGFMTEELVSIAMEKGSKDFQTAEDCADPKKERERVEAELQ